MDEKDRKNHIQNLDFATEALKFLGESLDSHIALPLRHSLVDNKGTAEELSVLLHVDLATASSCDSCLKDDEDVNEDVEICHYSCDSCQKEKSLCSTCQQRGLAAEQWNFLLRPCERCLVHKSLYVLYGFI